MKKRTINFMSLILLLFMVSACDGWGDVPDFDVEEVEGFRPIYATESEAEIKTLPPREIENPGKIYVINNYLLVIDQLKGVHVFDNQNASNPVNIGFLQIVGTNDVAVRDNILYADQAADLIALDISDPKNIKLTSKVKGVFPFGAQYPEQAQGNYFECADPAKGLVIGWEFTTLTRPECYR